jgi:hypothetical protein
MAEDEEVPDNGVLLTAQATANLAEGREKGLGRDKGDLSTRVDLLQLAPNPNKPGVSIKQVLRSAFLPDSFLDFDRHIPPAFELKGLMLQQGSEAVVSDLLIDEMDSWPQTDEAEKQGDSGPTARAPGRP